MSLHKQNGAGKEEEQEQEQEQEGEEEAGEDEFSDSEDDGYYEDMKALTQACLLTGTDLKDLQIIPAASNAAADENRPSTSAATPASGSDSEDDIELLRSIQSHFALSEDVCEEPLNMKPLCTLAPSDDDAEDDFETLRLIQKRFPDYSTNDTWWKSKEDEIQKVEPVYKSNMPLEDTTCNDVCDDFQNNKTAGKIYHLSSQKAVMQSVDLVHLEELDANELSTLDGKSSRFPKSAQLLIGAIKRNRSYQEFLRSKLTKIEAKIDENKKLKERVKVLRDFQVSCKKITGRALSLKKDLRIQLISARKSRTPEDPEDDDKKVADCGPPENSSVTSYRMALTKFPLTLQRKKWSKEERENLEKGIRQQFQERALQVSFSSDGSYEDGKYLDSIIATVKDLEITPQRMREFLPKVNWDQLASMYVKGRSGAECETRWLNHEDPLINRRPWTAEEDKNLLLIVQKKGIGNWFDIAVSLGSNRTPFQCLARYQRSLNACILKRDWTEEEDDQLRIAVEAFGECDWQSVASTLKGRTGTQCSNRWKKSLHPTRQSVGRWNRDEDKRLTVAVMLFGPKNWKKISEVVPGRTQVQCRERWVNSLDPSLNFGSWTKEEDSRLKIAIKKHGYCWSKIAASMPSRTDNQCWRRWKTLHPKVVPLLQEARRIRKTTLISNFVDRESERPALTPIDFCNSLPMITATSEPGNTDQPSKEKRKASSRRPKSKKGSSAVLRLCKGKRRHKSCRVKARPLEVQGMINENEAEIGSGHDAVWEKHRNTNSENNISNEAAEDVASTKKRKRKPPSGGANFSELARGVATQKKRRKEPSSGHTNCGDRMQDDAVQTQKTKQQLKTNKCIEPMQDSSSHQISTLCMTNNEAESFGSSLTMKRKTLPKPSPKQYSKRVHSDSGEEPRSVCSENSIFSGATDGAEVVQNNGVEVDTRGMDDVSSKKSSAIPGSKRKRCVHLSTSQSSRIGSAEGFKKISSNKSMEKRRNGSSMQQHRSRKRNEPSEAEDDITLASFLHDKKEKRIPSLADEDEMTLSCFLNKKSNKEKHQMVENAHLPILVRVYQRRKTNKTRSGLQHCEAKTNCDGPTPENSMFHGIGKQTDKETGGIDVRNETAEVVREPGRINEEGDCEADDISLASFCNKLRKRRPTNKSEKLNG